MAAQVQQQPWTGIQIETSFFPLSFFLYLCTPTIVIDGVACQRPWGSQFLSAGAGHAQCPDLFQVFTHGHLRGQCN